MAAIEPSTHSLKRLAEVDLPIAAISGQSAREKAAPTGHPSMLHLWWARRPLASCRAVLLALLLPDPCDPKCPDEFKKNARKFLAGSFGEPPSSDQELRESLLKFIAQSSEWENAHKPESLRIARGLVGSAFGADRPLVVDPFAGGGSIPLEALRIGCDTFASDLNPVATLILDSLLTKIPKQGRKLSVELKAQGEKIGEAAEVALNQFFPSGGDGTHPIAYLWARTVRCEAPRCGSEIPLVHSFWLSRRNGHLRALRYRKVASRNGAAEVEFEVFEPHHDRDREVPKATVSRGKATCVGCGAVLAIERVRFQLAAQRGGADAIFDKEGQRLGGARLLAVVTTSSKKPGRDYRPANALDYTAVWKAAAQLREVAAEKLPTGLTVVPDEPLPPIGTLGFRVQRYGIATWGDLFSARQKLALLTLQRLVRDMSRETDSLSLLALALDRVVMSDMSLTRWNAVAEKMQHTFGRQALPIVWDFAEVVPTADAPGSWESGYRLIAEIVDSWLASSSAGEVQLADARRSPLPNEACDVWFTDPPYYDAVPYADLSDFFYVWLKRTLPGHPLLSDPFDRKNPLTPKEQEIVEDDTKVSAGRVKDRTFFENAMEQAFAEGRRILKEDGIGCVIFAHKTTEGWEALLSGMVRGGWVITSSWPIATEMGTRLRARDSAALATSVHLICRPRSKDARVGDWASILNELPKRVTGWMVRLQREGIRGADLVFACVGPALELFSQYSRVETADGGQVELREFLPKVWETVGRSALDQVLGTAGLATGRETIGFIEDDARLSAIFLWTLQSTNAQDSGATSEDSEEEGAERDTRAEGDTARKAPGYSLMYDIVRRFAQPLGIHLEDWEGRVIETEKGVVRLLPVAERTQFLFEREGLETVADRIQLAKPGGLQSKLLHEPSVQLAGKLPQEKRGRAEGDFGTPMRREGGWTTLDRVHTAMLLQSAGRSGPLRAFLTTELKRGPQFSLLANALSALYPKESEEKRLLDAVLLVATRGS